MSTAPRMPLLDLLSQDDVWQTRDGSILALEDLTAEHRAALLPWLRKHARMLQLAEQMQFVSMPMPDVDTVAFDMVMGDVMDWLNTAPEEWLEEQALVRRLRELDEATSEPAAANGTRS